MTAIPIIQGSATASAPVARPGKTSAVERIKEEARGSVAVSTARATGKVGFVRSTGDLLPSMRGATRADAVRKATAFVQRNARAFGTQRSELVRARVDHGRLGWTVTFTQSYRGVPVFGAMLRAHVTSSGRLTSVNGAMVPVRSAGVVPRLTPRQAAYRAVRLVRAEPPGRDGARVSLSGVHAKRPALVLYRQGLVQGVAGGRTGLVYRVEVTNNRNIREMVFVSAITGKIVNRYSMIDDALYRMLYEARTNGSGKTKYHLVWNEGDRLPGNLNTDQENMVRSTGDAYWLFKNTFGRDSFDAQGARMITINNDPRISCPNANWNGQTTNYCNGVSSDDVVAHEWGHAYTEYTSGLIYQWQAGAMNEAYSDIWGETVDLINGRQDDGENVSKRNVGECSTHSPALPVLEILSPSDIAKICQTGGASFGAPVTPTGLSGSVVQGLDVAETGGTTTDGCSPFTNAAALAGKVAMVDRGLCSFESKAVNAKAAGALALIIVNRDPAPVGMGGSGDTTLPTTVSIGSTDGASIKTKLAAGTPVTVSIKDAGGVRADSYRWLMAEDSPAFGGAIRDMWTPTCYGDPGKVSDAEYKCGTDDNGGVHSNSGVVNHAYALLVDGGTYNGVTVKGIGLDKAANIFWRAQSAYLTPVSGFPELATSLGSSCTDLQGKAINKLSTVPRTTERDEETITADDCAQVTAVTQAVELNRDPTAQCGWKPLLDPNAPNLCGAGTETAELFSEDFEDGLNGWAASGSNPYGGETLPWEATSTYHGDHTSQVAKGPDPRNVGDCSATTSDISSVDYITGPSFTVPAGTAAPRMSFEHYIATETGYDGGNVQISVNGGAFAPIPAAAYTFNPPGKLSTTAEGSTNPLQGQPGFTGTNPGSLFGSWGQSQVDLTKAGVAPGNTVQLRLAMGRDGCGGVDGWYVDNIRVVACDIPAATPARTGTKPARRGATTSR